METVHGLRRLVLSFLVLALQSAGLYAAAEAGVPDLKFIPVSSGLLPTAEVRILFQDSDGFIWLPTYNGLVRFDGYECVTFGLDPDDGVLFNSYLNVVAEDLHKSLWIAAREGVFVLDKTTGRTRKVPHGCLPEIDARSILCTRSGDIWVDGDCGLYRKMEGEDVFLKVSPGNVDIIGVSDIIEDKEGNIWVAACENGLYLFDKSSGKCLEQDEPALKYADALFEDRDGNIWIGTWDRGLVRMSRDSSGNHACDIFVHDDSDS